MQRSLLASRWSHEFLPHWVMFMSCKGMMAASKFMQERSWYCRFASPFSCQSWIQRMSQLQLKRFLSSLLQAERAWERMVGWGRMSRAITWPQDPRAGQPPCKGVFWASGESPSSYFPRVFWYTLFLQLQRDRSYTSTHSHSLLHAHTHKVLHLPGQHVDTVSVFHNKTCTSAT